MIEPVTPGSDEAPVLKARSGAFIEVVNEEDFFEVLVLRSQVSYQGAIKPMDCKRPYDRDGVHLGALFDDQLVGVVSLWPDERSFNVFVDGEPKVVAAQWRLAMLCLRESHRDRGVARDLLEQAYLHAAHLGATAVWGSARVGLVGFYERWGPARW